ncbi:agarase [Clostridium beijerinckii]|uniref:agarase n=1 Tax=Clostridium beijerinckii TaxID=1520 RepID=UPI001361D866|nr:agarase [Clostridium beijerinckii]MZK52111.1 agarase [Clostridium beijerinckii]MZK61268.1 agarase [Clostridium beijerinckii]MZK71511.1 agarase [Clostridium beijerinckii]MZK76870.1 agarase [Clostridium beijerinckii]MZK85504.1 agarase [Clostridium beijerinckii]
MIFKKLAKTSGLFLVAMSLMTSSLLGEVKVNAATTTVNFTKVSFETGESTPYYDKQSNTVSVVSNQGNTDGTQALKVDYAAGSYPSVIFMPPANTAWNFGNNNCLSFTVKNPMSKAQDLYIKLNLINNATNSASEVVFKANIKANQQTTVLAAQNKLKELGMLSNPPYTDGVLADYGWGTQNLDNCSVSQISFFLMNTTSVSTLIFDNLCSVTNPTISGSYLNGIIDKYGQYTKQSWTGKITSDSQLTTSATNEQTTLTSQLNDIKATANFSKYGGYNNASLKQTATGHFYAKKINNKWSLVDPEGYPYIATGLDIVRLGDASTWVSGRETMFSSIPSKTSSLGDHYSTVSGTLRSPNNLTSGDAFNFYTANLERKYGQDYVNKWKSVALQRFKSWGFTSMGCWSDPDMFFGKGAQNQVAYVANGWTSGTHKEIFNGNSFWGNVPDPYDPKFKTDVDTMVTTLKNKGVNEDPWCIGVYVDNEIPWGNGSDSAGHYLLIKEIFKMNGSDSTAYAKKGLIDFLKYKYNNNISALNTAWGTSISSWTTLTNSYTGIIGDNADLLYQIADKYYKTVHDSLAAQLPNKLYLGSRFAEWGVGSEVIGAASQYCDVVSFNCYKNNINQSWLNTGSADKPIIIGEFHFNSSDHGQFAPGLCPVSTQNARGTAYDTYMKSVLANSKLVGAQWFQYYDQPTLGRVWDGENSNAGFVDITDQPYTPLVDSARSINKQLYKLKFN